MFGKSELRAEIEELKKANEALAVEVERGAKRLDEQKKKSEAVTGRIAELEDKVQEAKEKSRKQSDECRKLERMLDATKDAEKQKEWEFRQRDETIARLQQEWSAQKARLADVDTQIAALRKEINEKETSVQRLQVELTREKERKERVREEPAPRVQQRFTADDDPAKTQAYIGKLKAQVFEKEGLARRLSKMVEHNRRAYIITRLQLDLALDELHLVKTGSARRDTAQSRGQRPPAPEETYNPDSEVESMVLEAESVSAAPAAAGEEEK